MLDVLIAEDGQSLTLFSAEQKYQFHGIWLLDNAPDARDQGNGQRLLSFDKLPDYDDQDATRIHRASVTPQALSIDIGPAYRHIDFDISWLLAHAYDRVEAKGKGWVDDSIKLWNATGAVPQGDFNDIHNSRTALRDWLGKIRAFGFAKLVGGPVREGALLDIAALFGYVRETNYGLLFDVRSEVNPINLAYTGLGLQAHTDNPYRDPVPSMQILYCLENSANGGDSQVVDGFAAATQLRDTDPSAFESLTSHPVRFTYEGASGVHLTSVKPIIELGVDGALRAVHFNNRSIAPFSGIPFDQMPEFYRAIKAFGALIDAPENQIGFKLAPGESFIVDNQRVLHGRSGYEGEGTRWLQGCYPDRDGLYSTLLVLEAAKSGATS